MRIVDLSPLGWLAVSLPVASSVAFFILGKGLPLSRRIFASIHGVAALAILPLCFFAMATFPGFSENSGIVLMLVVGGIAATSIFYAISVVRTQWYVHLLHVPTLAVIAGGFVFARFLLYGH